MHIRVSRVRRNGKTYEYVQLVESFRRKHDGMPAHRVVANLGRMDPASIDNLRAAFRANRSGEQVVVAEQHRAPSRRAPKPTANLAYLDVAVLHELWNSWQLNSFFERLLPDSSAEVHPSLAFESLAIHRCLAARSKLHATRWFERTALPELLGVHPRQFHNTRLHRDLEQLEALGPALMDELPKLYRERDGDFVVLFADVTDAWFVGDGPSMSSKGKTKEGMVRQKIAIALMCNESGYPMRWATLEGSKADSTVLSQLLDDARGKPWLLSAPVVFDRAMGKTAHIVRLIESDVRFLTALTTPEFGSYAASLPYQRFVSLPAPNEEEGAEAIKKAVEEASEQARQAGMAQVADDLFALDLGLVRRDDIKVARPTEAADPVAAALSLATEVTAEVAEGRYRSYAAAARARGLGGSLLSKYRKLLHLPESVRRDILDGRAQHCLLTELCRIATSGGEPREQRAEFDDLVAMSSTKPPGRRPGPRGESSAEAPPLEVRAVIAFNPCRFVEQRLTAQRRLEAIAEYVEQLNAKLANPNSKRTPEKIHAAVDRKLRSYSLVEAFDIHVDEELVGRRARYRVRVECQEEKWLKRQRYHGFVVLVAHPEVDRTAGQLCLLYREKDAVEKDFQVIKSVLRVRPMYHRRDHKVRAHVTLCMLALLLERTLHKRLAGKHSAQAALELLAGCHLNMYRREGREEAAYTITAPDADQGEILATLGLSHLTDDTTLVPRLGAR